MAGTELRADARRNRDNLLTVARRMIIEEGADVSLRDVARRAGVGIGTLYRHFPTREALLEAALRKGIDALRVAADEALTAPAPGAALLDVLTRFSVGYGIWCALPNSMLTTNHDGVSGVSEVSGVSGVSEVHGASRGMAEAVDRLLRKAQEVGEVRTDVDAEDLLAAAKGLGWLAENAGRERAARITAVLRDGLLIGPGTSASAPAR